MIAMMISHQPWWQSFERVENALIKLFEALCRSN